MKKPFTFHHLTTFFTLVLFTGIQFKAHSECNAAFTYSQSPNSLLVSFTDASSSDFEVISWLWHFGDGGVSDNHAPTHTYSAPGTYEVCLTIHDNHGCEDSFCQNIVVEAVNQECNALFTYIQTPGTLTIHFDDQSTSPHDITTWHWTFGDGETSTAHEPVHTYDTPGTYEVCLMIHDNNDCNDTYCTNVVVEPVSQGDCNADFGYYQTPNTLIIHFQDSSSSNHDIISWLWHFGDGGISDNHAPTHTYNEAGTYEVCLTIHDNSGCEDTYCQNIVVEPINQEDCNALFEYGQLANTLSIHFEDLSTSSHDIISWFWNFGDGETSDAHEPTHTYDQPGSYEVCLTIHDNSGCEDVYCHLVVVEPVSGGECNANFNSEQLPGTLTLHFHDQSTSNHDIISWLWHFGDGGVSDDHHPYHTFDSPGTYVVCLTIHDNTGCVDSTCMEVVVEPATPGECNALFTYEQVPGTLTIHFVNQSTSNHDIISWLWHFGDGGVSDNHAPTHTYDQPGTYEVCLTIHDNSGCEDSFCLNVIVEPVTGGECNAVFDSEQLPNTLTLHFHDHSTSNHDINSWIWHFGDGGVSDDQHPYHTFDQPGTYVVCLTIHDNSGCVDSTCMEVVVEPVQPGECNASFTFEQVPGTLTVHFVDHSTSNHDIVSWLWHFGDGGISDNHAPTHTYDQPGTYEVCLTIHDNTGCEDTYCTVITVEPVNNDCQASFNWEQVDSSLTVHFFNNSSSPHDIISFIWHFGDGHVADGPNPTHTYEHSGSYEVCLTIHDNANCVSTWCTVVTIEASASECQAYFSYEQQPNTLTVFFNDTSYSSNTIVSWLWHFGDGGVSDNPNPHHTYAHGGTYEVCLTIHDDHGCTDTHCYPVVVEGVQEQCHAVFSWDVDSTGLTVYFTNMSTNTTPNTTYLWTFGDGTESTEENPVHTYDHFDNYTVCLYLNDPDIDCENHVCHIVHVNIAGGANQGIAIPFAAHNDLRAKEADIPATQHIITIYPNPAVSSATIGYDLTSEADVRIDVSDLYGNQLIQVVNTREVKGAYDHTLHLSDLYPGIYMVRVMINDEIQVKKITVTR
jgi:PKD repeat protein